MTTHVESFSRLWDGYATDEDALRARDERARALRAQIPGNPGMSVKCATIPDQMKKYDGFGKYNGGVCNVYQIEVRET